MRNLSYLALGPWADLSRLTIGCTARCQTVCTSATSLCTGSLIRRLAKPFSPTVTKNASHLFGFWLVVLLSVLPFSAFAQTGNNSTCQGVSVPSALAPGQTVSVTVLMANTGTTTWSSSGNYSLGSQNPQDNTTWGIGRVPLPQSVSPNGTANFTFSITAPAEPGDYHFQWRMVQDGVEWFGAYTSDFTIHVYQSSAIRTGRTGYANGSATTPVQGDQIQSIDWIITDVYNNPVATSQMIAGGDAHGWNVTSYTDEGNLYPSQLVTVPANAPLGKYTVSVTARVVYNAPPGGNSVYHPSTLQANSTFDVLSSPGDGSPRITAGSVGQVVYTNFGMGYDPSHQTSSGYYVTDGNGVSVDTTNWEISFDGSEIDYSTLWFYGSGAFTVFVPPTTPPGVYRVNFSEDSGGTGYSYTSAPFEVTNTAQTTLDRLTINNIMFLIPSNVGEENYDLSHGWTLSLSDVFQAAPDEVSCCVPDDSRPMYRFYKGSTGDHYYSTSPYPPAGYTADGPQGYYVHSGPLVAHGSGVSGSPGLYNRSPLYGAYNSSTQQHFYCQDVNEYNNLSNSWTRLGPIAYSDIVYHY